MCIPKIRAQPCSTDQRMPSRLRAISDLSNIPSSPKRISFNERVLVHNIRERSSDMSPQVKSQAYYSKDELKALECELIQIRSKVIHQARLLAKSNPALSPCEHLSSILERDTSLRGYEVQLSPTRIRNKNMVMGAVLKCQKQLKTLEASMSQERRTRLLAQVYASLSLPAKDQSIRTARSDQEQAYSEYFYASRRPAMTPVSGLNAKVASPMTAMDKRSFYLESEGSALKKRRFC